MENEIQPANNANKDLVREELCNMNIHLAPAQNEVDLSRAKQIPLGQIASLGTAFASMPEAVRTVVQTTTLPGNGLLQAFDAAGKQIDFSLLQKYKDGSGALGSTRIGGKFQQVHLREAGAQTLTSTTIIPFDPTTLAIAIALQQLNQKLDNIQKTVDEMFSYMREHDKSKMQGNLQTLAEIINKYSLNWDNELYINNAHMKVLDIKQEAMQDMDFYKKRVDKKLNDKAPIEVRGMVEDRLNGVLDSLKDYQLATYIYSFAAFLEPMLAENYKQDKLNDVAHQIEEASIRYREMYTRCYDELEASTKGSIDSAVMGGLSFAGKALGKAIAATPVGDHTPIDEALEGGGKMIGGFNHHENARLMEKLHAAKSPDVLPFQENVANINALYNQSNQLLTDGENLYLLPTEED